MELPEKYPRYMLVVFTVYFFVFLIGMNFINVMVKYDYNEGIGFYFYAALFLVPAFFILYYIKYKGEHETALQLIIAALTTVAAIFAVFGILPLML